MQIVFIGAGRLASQLAPSLQAAGHEIAGVFSRTTESALLLANRLHCSSACEADKLNADADVYIFAVTDRALPQLAKAIAGHLAESRTVRREPVFLHTAGSVAMSVFQTVARHYGVLYPMQTFSKERKVDFARVPFFIEGSDDFSLSVARLLATSLSTDVRQLSSDVRRRLHLAAVFACNFANHCYQLSAEILEQCGLSFDVMLPLIDETAAKVHQLSPRQAQTGPAVRYDENVIQAQLRLLEDMPFHGQVYDLMSRSIHHSQQK